MLKGVYPEKLTRAARYLGERLEALGVPVVSPFQFSQLVWRIYAEADGRKLYLRDARPAKEDITRLRNNLKKNGVIGLDRDYGARIIRILANADLPAEGIVCLADPTIHVSHQSAMQRWGLTNRRPEALILTRPDRVEALRRLDDYMERHLLEGEESLFSLKLMAHPDTVRHRPIHIHETKSAGASIESRGDHVRLSTIGQTFLDMLQKPDLCGGMGHVLEVWEEHAALYLGEIVRAVDTASSPLVKSRAGYILEERLALAHPGIEPWKALGQRGSSRKLDPTKAFAPAYSETWMISLNA
jgi:predicted transcriptional regulator of viral defense system